MMKNISQMMKQAQQLQGKMSEAQEKVAKIECDGSSGGGMVSVTLGGKYDLKKLKIDKSIMEDGDVEMIEDLIVAAYQDAKKKVEKESEELMKDATGGINIPGLQLPF
jgi:DNA-binding YbaB/EbfC family protein